METLELIINAIGALLIPLALFYLGKYYTDAKERKDQALQESEQISKYITMLASDSKTETMLALLSLNHLKENGKMSEELVSSVQYFLDNNDPVIASKAALLLGEQDQLVNLNSEEKRLVYNVLLPLEVYFKRTGSLFKTWISKEPKNPDIAIEQYLHEANTSLQSILLENLEHLPESLHESANQLINHLNAWLIEYDELRPKGKRKLEPAFVFVGPKGYGYPREAEQKFLDHLNSLRSR
ncbi:MAG: hypothetical protein N4A46_17185 [Schleiferiaceae bacterium]|jgi:hypothetical protein|nr:hypothetical protein [Schleiferiaceae bacterium]